MGIYNSENSMKSKGSKNDLVRADKLVYANFVDKSLDVMDDSWDLEHIDGNPNNCKVTNLKLKISSDTLKGVSRGETREI